MYESRQSQCQRDHQAYDAYCPRKYLSRLAWDINVSPLSVHDLCTNRLRIFSILSILAPLGWRLLPAPANIHQHRRTIRICMSCSLTVHVNEAKLNSTRACGHHFRCDDLPTSADVVFRTNPAAQGDANPASDEFKHDATCLKSQGV